MTDKSIVGDLINFRGLVYAPMNENGVIFLFGKVADDLNMYIEEIKPGYPDCIGRRYNGKGWEKVAIEFEYKSSNFKLHKHDPKDCDVIICWENDWKDCPLEIIELKSEIQDMENYPVSKPEPDGLSSKNNTIDTLFKNSNENIKKLFEKLFQKLKDYNPKIWAKIGTKYSGWYSPVKSFVSLKPSSQSILIQCYSGKDPINGTVIQSERFAPNWCRFSIKSESDLDNAVNILIESHKRLEKALSSGKATGFFSDGEQFGTTKEIMDSEDDND